MSVWESKLCSEDGQILCHKRISTILVEMHIDDGNHKMHKHFMALLEEGKKYKKARVGDQNRPCRARLL